MKAASLFALLALQTGAAVAPIDAGFLRYRRAVELPTGAGQACAALDAVVFAHAEPSLADLRLFGLGSDGAIVAGGQEIPYVVTVSRSATDETQAARIVNLSAAAGGRIAFDLGMPARSYSEVVLGLAAQNFVGTAVVSGETRPGVAARMRSALGSFTVFDLSARHLGHDTTLRLAESTFPYLHVELTMAATGGSGERGRFTAAIVSDASVPPSRSGQTVYTPVARTMKVTHAGGASRATFRVAARVPVERVTVVLAPGYRASFSREVRITATPLPAATGARSYPLGSGAKPGGSPRGGEQVASETVTGTILRVQEMLAGREIRAEELSVPATLGANLQSPARVEVAVDDGAQPLSVAAVVLEMRQRRLCFEVGAQTAGGAALYYGDPDLEAPVYEYEQLFHPETRPLAAMLGPEMANPGFRGRAAARGRFTERHPDALWVGLIAAVCVLGMVGLRRARSVSL